MTNVTRQDVFSAAEKLEAGGQSVTVASLRGLLGRGSATTITKFLREVRAAKAKPDGLPEDLDPERVPDEFLERFVAAARKLAAESYLGIAVPLNAQIAKARAEHAEEKALLQSDISQVVADAGDAIERAESLERERHETSKREAGLIAEVASLRERSGQLSRELEALQKKHSEEVARLQTQIAESAAELRRFQERAEAANVATAELRGRMAAFAEIQNR